MIAHRRSCVRQLVTIFLFSRLLTASNPSPYIVRAQPTGGDVFSSDRGSGGKTWWDVKRKDYPECAGLVDQHEEMTKELYRLDAEAKRTVEPRRKQLVQQINDLSKQRTKVQRQIFGCIRESSKPPSDDGQKGLKRVPEQPPQQDTQPAPVTFDKAVDDCFSKSVPNYRSPDWSRFTPESLRPKRIGQFEQSFLVSTVAADQALQLDELVHGKWKDRELMQDYLIGWLTHCLSENDALPMQDPRGSYAQFLRKSGQGRS